MSERHGIIQTVEYADVTFSTENWYSGPLSEIYSIYERIALCLNKQKMYLSKSLRNMD